MLSLSAASMSSFGKCLLIAFAHFLMGLGFSCKFKFLIDARYYAFVRCIVCKVFSHSVSHLLTLLTVSFAVQKLFSLIRSHLSIFAFAAIAFGVFLIKSLPDPMSRIVLRRSSSRVFIFLGFIFKSFIQIELIFVHGVEKGFSFNLLHMTSQLSQHHLLNKESFPHCLFLSGLLKTVAGMWPYFWVLYSVLSVYESFLVPVARCFGFRSPVV